MGPTLQMMGPALGYLECPPCLGPPVMGPSCVSPIGEQVCGGLYILSSPRLIKLTQEIVSLVDRWGMELCPCYLHGVVNIEVDALSCAKQVTKWHIGANLVNVLFNRWGHPEIDLFVSQCNAVLLAFFLVDCCCHNALTFDAFHQPWSFHWGYSFPP